MIRQGREEFYTEKVDLTKVESTLPDGMTGTLLADCVTDTETRRLAHAFLADLAGSRKAMQKKSSRELIATFMRIIFDKMMARLEENPFDKYYVVSISSTDKELIDVSNLYSLLHNVDMKSVMNEINAKCEDIGVQVEAINPEKWGHGNYYIPVGIRFVD